MKRWLAASVAALMLATLAFALSTEAEAIVLGGFFTDDNGSTFEADIDSIAAVGITRGCNPPANDRFCPRDAVDRGQMAAFIRRSLELPAASTDHFSDDNSSTFEGDINAIADRGITRGCNPPANTRYCPTRNVTRGEMAAFLNRALELPAHIQRIPMGDHTAMSCSKDGERCTLAVDLSANRPYLVREGVFQVNPASSGEESQFNSSNTSFALTLDGSTVSLTELSQQTTGNVTSRFWRRDLQFNSGTHTLVGRWRWNGQVVQTTTITIRASNQ